MADETRLASLIQLGWALSFMFEKKKHPGCLSAFSQMMNTKPLLSAAGPISYSLVRVESSEKQCLGDMGTVVRDPASLPSAHVPGL